MNGLPDNVEDAYPLTPMQLGMVYHSLMEPESGGYLEQFHCRLEGEFEPEAFQAAWKEVYALHGALRAIYLWEGLDDPIQVVRREVSLPWSIEDWSDRSPPARAEAFAAFLRDDRQQALD
ncbi:MAG: condensation domain-containing protein, partial [Rhodothermales bacterium]